MPANFPKLKGSRSWLVKAARDMFANAEGQATEQLDAENERVKRIAEREQDKQLLTEVEKFDLDMLDRVRGALYAE